MMDLRPVLEQQLDRTAGIVAGVKTDQLDDPTPCETYDVRALLNHLIGGVLTFVELAEGKTVDYGAPTPDRVGGDPGASYREATTVLKQALSQPGVLEQTFTLPFGEVPGERALRVALLEAVVHGWDLAKATGQDTMIDPLIAGPMLEGVRKNLPAEVRGPGRGFGPVVEIPDDAPVGDRLIAFLGRRP